MKTVEEIAFAKYLSDQSLPERKRMDVSNYLDWANFGKNEAQRFININDELPEQGIQVIVQYDDYTFDCAYYFEAKGRKRFYNHCEPDIDFILEHITHWRPINRK